VDAWKQGFKARLRVVVRAEDTQRPDGSQRKLAKRWLGNVSKSPQVCAWCNPEREDVPEGAEKLHLLRERCGVDLNWLLSGPGAPPEPKSRSGWTAARRQKLANELEEFGLNLLYGRERIPFGVRVVEAPLSSQLRALARGERPKLNPLLCTWTAVQGDFLKFFAAEVARLGDAMAAMCEVCDPTPDAHVARTGRKELRALARRINRPR
jgi:hypothetical protein